MAIYLSCSIAAPAQHSEPLRARRAGAWWPSSYLGDLLRPAVVLLGLLSPSLPASALDWSDTSVSWRYGTRYAEPFIDRHIRKNVFALTHASGYAYGSNYFNLDVLLSDTSDPSRVGGGSGATEAYALYRHTLSLGKLRGSPVAAGPIRDLGLTAGFDLNTKDDAGYNSRKRMFVLGPTLMADVPGFFDISVLMLWESNRPSVSRGAFDPGYPRSRTYFKPHPMLGLAWGIPLGERWSFAGYANFIAAKGRNEAGGPTVPETNIDMQIMYDMSLLIAAASNTVKAGFQYQYWRNKFGNDHDGPAGSGAFARTPMARIEFHF